MTNPPPPPPSFRKTKNGKWAVMATVAELEAALAAGGKIEVTKKNGDKSSFVVGSLGKPFDVDGLAMCYGYSPADSDSGDQPRPRTEAPPPPPAADEPMPEYRGGPEDEWSEEW